MKWTHSGKQNVSAAAFNKEIDICLYLPKFIEIAQPSSFESYVAALHNFWFSNDDRSVCLRLDESERFHSFFPPYSIDLR